MNIIVAGGGEALYFIGKSFISKGHRLTVIDPDLEECVGLSRRLKAEVVHGAAADPLVLENAGARSADLVLAMTPKDQDNLMISRLASLTFGVERTLALVNDPDNEAFFGKLGVPAFSLAPILSNLIEQRASVDDIVNLLPIGEGLLQLAEVILAAESPVVGKTLREINLPEGTLLASIVRGDRPIVPRGPTRLEAGDRVVLVSTPENYGKLIKAVTGES